MKRNVQGYIYISLSHEDSNWNWIAIKTNKEGKWMTTFGEKEYDLPLSQRLQLFAKWIGNVAEYRMVAYGHETYHAFFSEVERYHSNAFSRHLVRMMKAQLWNIKSECMYRFQIKENITIRELLFLYKQDWLKNPQPLVEEAINLLTLANLFLFDSSQTKKLMKKSKDDVLADVYERYSVNELLMFFMSKGYKLSVQPYSEQEFCLSLEGEKNVIHEMVGQNIHALLVSMVVQLHPLKNS